jgi:hypothetical protein
MAVKKIMDTFFASMQEQTMAGYGGKLVNTPMGPFRWNDTMQLWENVNNGMVMNNISFQDSIMMLDYASYDGGGIPTVSGGDPSLILYLNFAANSIGSMTYSRGGTASYIDSDKLVKFVAPNTPRFSYYPLGTTNGLLVEQGTTNILERSETFNNASSWTVPTAEALGFPDNTFEPVLNITVGSGLDPSGNTEHYLFTPNDSTFLSSPTRRINSTDKPLQAGVTYTVSVWAKPHGHTFNRYFGITVSGNNQRAWFDLVGLTSSLTFVGNPNSGGFARINPYENGWYRGEMTFVGTGSGEIWLSVLNGPVDPPSNEYNVPVGTTSGIMFWGAQLEENSYSSSYIRTTGSTATRGNDFAYFSGTGFTSWFGASQGTFLIEYDSKDRGHTADNVKIKTLLSTNWNSGTSAGFAVDYIGTNAPLRFRATTLPTICSLAPINGITVGINKVAFSYSYDLTGTTLSVFANLNGLLSASGSIPSTRLGLAGASFMTFGYKETELGATAVDYLNTLIRSVKYWNVVKTPAELQQLSS